MKKFFVCVFIYMTSYPNCSWAQFSRLDENSERTINRVVGDYMKIGSLVGVSIGVIKNREIIFLKGYGYSDKSAGVPATECTMYRVASVAKSITAAAALKLIEEGKLNYEDDVRDYVPEFPEKEQGPIRIHHLLQHAGCIANSSSTNQNYIDNHASFNAIEAVGLFQDEPLRSNCTLESSNGNYSNWGYNLLGAVIERAAEMKYQKYIKRKIINPLNLPLLQPEYANLHPYPNQSKGYESDGTLYTGEGSATGSYVMHLPSGGFIGSVTDLTLFARGLMKASIFKNANTRDDLFFLENLDLSTKMVVSFPYALGMRQENRNGETYYFHNGDDVLSSTIIYFSSDLKNGVAIMTNRKTWTQAGTIPFANSLCIRIPSLNVVNPSLYNERPVEHLITLSGTEVGNAKEFAKKVKAEDYLIKSTGKVKLFGEKILLQDGFKTQSGAYLFANFRNANPGCWNE